MTIREARGEVLKVLNVLNQLEEEIGDDGLVVRIAVSKTFGTEIFLDEPSMLAVVAAFPHVEASVAPVDEVEFPGECYWTMGIDGVTVFTLLNEEEE